MSLAFCPAHDGVFSISLREINLKRNCFPLKKASHLSFGRSTSQIGEQQKCSYVESIGYREIKDFLFLKSLPVLYGNISTNISGIHIFKRKISVLNV